MRDNPARRLKKILFDTSSKISGNQSIQRSWAQFFGFNVDDTVEVNRRLLQLVDLLHEVKQKVADINSPGTSIHLKALEQLERSILPANLSQSWQSVYVRGTRDALQFCEEVFDMVYPDDGIEDINLHEMSSRIEELEDEIRNSNVNTDLKERIGEILEDVKNGIKNYEFFGDKGIQEPILYLVGTIVVNQPEINEKSPAFLEKAIGFVANSIQILSFVTQIDKLHQLADAIRGFLPRGQ